MADPAPESFVAGLTVASPETERIVKLQAGIPAGFMIPEVADAALAAAIRPGVERWSVKTGTDPGAIELHPVLKIVWL